VGAVVLVLILVLGLSSGKPEETVAAPAAEKAVTVEPADPAWEDLQGLWYYTDAEVGWHEELYLWEGNAAGITWLESVPEKANVNEATYEIDDGILYLHSPSTGYTAEFEYEYQDGELVLQWFIDSGRGAGTYRVYEKRSSSQAPKSYIPRDKDTAATNATKRTDTENVTADMRNALRQAKQYLEVMPFSRQGLIDQLEFEGYGYTEAVYAVDNCGADWYEQAALKAESYLQIMAFSRQGLIEQLQYEGFLYDQAVYGVEEAY